MFPEDITENTKTSKASSTSWSKFKDPRIVRVSRAFGGKDRHSKVCTVRGLRDRRVRLSVPTAIQLYDLQDRLGLNQPSKVVDWLLNAAKHEIDELPPLHIPQGISFTHNYESNKQGLNISLGKSKDFSGETSGRYESHDHQEEIRHLNSENPSFLPSVVNNNMPSFVRWNPSNLSLSQPSRFHGSTAQIEDWHNLSLVPLASTLSIPNSGSHQFLMYQSGMSSTQSYFPSQFATLDSGFELKEPNFHSLQLSNSSAAQPVRPIQFGMTANFLTSQSENEQNKGNEFHLGQP